MPAPSRAARARLPALPRSRSRRIDAARAELASCTLALHAAASGIAAGFHSHMIDGDGAYELLLSVHDRQAHALAQLDAALRGIGGGQ